MPGVIVKLLVAPGEAVTRGQPLLIMEAMKMEHRICAPAAGAVSAFCFEAGDSVDGGEELLQFEPADSARE
jgi:3-methylcrotonyl-CoA carboxylase alpha subunit